MTVDRLFPLDLLQKSKAERLAYFENYTMEHPHLEKAFKRIKPIIRYPGETKIINIVGPTGAGKTTLRKLLEKWIVEELIHTLQFNPGRLPFASVTASLHEKTGIFDSKTHWIRCLEALKEPKEFIKHKINYGASNVFYDDRGQLVVKPKVLQTELGWATEQALKNRNPVAFFVDEAHHTLCVTSGRKLSDIPEAFKSLAILTGVVHCLIGTYDLLTLQDIGDQLTRRSVYIHLPRYDAEYIEDREIWKDIIWTLQAQIPIIEQPDLEAHWEFLYDRCLGYMGILKDLILRAFADALEEDACTITLNHIEGRVAEPGMCFNYCATITITGSKTVT
ncbi:AAA family ATPase [Leptolyngbya ohadii]|uniref:AAA family ATPase n=1 Tax=Leptolyngbya ohadii TaxID=1962290 RepID=UPI000B5985F2|nr:AAA family ATPase [Leptolyngbya ohadii]